MTDYLLSIRWHEDPDYGFPGLDDDWCQVKWEVEKFNPRVVYEGSEEETRERIYLLKGVDRPESERVRRASRADGMRARFFPLGPGITT